MSRPQPCCLAILSSPGTAPESRRSSRRSHGEAFLALFEHRFEGGLYLLDESEAALSPQRPLAFLRIMRSLAAHRVAQFIVATHAPNLLCLPGARAPRFDHGAIVPMDVRDTERWQLTRFPE